MKRIVSTALAFLILSPGPLFAGTVRTKDLPKEGGGYYEGGYHLKKKGQKEGLVDKEHNWRNPFKGFLGGGKKQGDPKKQCLGGVGQGC